MADWVFQRGRGELFVDEWCAKNVRRVWRCADCLWFAECSERGASVAPSAKERAAKIEAERAEDEKRLASLAKRASAKCEKQADLKSFLRGDCSEGIGEKLGFAPRKEEGK